MRVVVTGAAGFIGRRLTATLLRHGALVGPDHRRAPIRELVLADVADVPPPLSGNVNIRIETGDFCDPEFRHRIMRGGVDSVFHLAATLTTAAEADLKQALAVNVGSLIELLELCREQSVPPRFVYASSIATFGGTLPEVVDDDLPQRPQTSYGTHKAIAELLINDYSRHGIVDGRALRLPIVVIRGGTGASSVSDRVAAVVREPLAGREVVCPFAPETRMPIASVRNVAEALCALHDLPAGRLGDTRAMNLPALSVSVADMLAALERVAPGRAGQVRFEPDPVMQAIVDGWPKGFGSTRATRLGINADSDFDSVIRDFVEQQPQ